jgi:hypothetical protein
MMLINQLMNEYTATKTSTGTKTVASSFFILMNLLKPSFAESTGTKFLYFLPLCL